MLCEWVQLLNLETKDLTQTVTEIVTDWSR
jgi:hypothetical protein